MSEHRTSEAPGNAAAGAVSEGHAWPLWVALALLGATCLLVWVRNQPAALRPATAPAGQFSAVRAEAVLGGILGDQEPHPVGSAADGRVRQAILGELRRLGYQPHVESAFACNSNGVCAQIQNVLARLDGSEGGKAILLAAHYDSVPAGPGASDDGAGVGAVLEIARALKAGPAPRHPVIFLLDEGEEAGLLGAVAFVEQSPWAHEVGAAVNLEARGTSGPSLMFETGSHSLWLMPLFARAVSRPLANSLYYAVYRRLPNDTDFSVFRKHGFDGFNFAFIGGVTRYHTPLDNLRHLDSRSLESHGEHALGLVRALANAELGAPAPGRAVFFDVAGWRMIWWPVGWTVWLAGVAFLLLLGCAWGLFRRGTLWWKALAAGMAAWPVTVVVAGLVAAGLLVALRAMGSVPGGWVAHPAALIASAWFVGLAVAWGIGAWLGRRIGFDAFWCGVWLWWGVLALLTAFVMPEMSFLWVVPTLAAGIFGVVMALSSAPIWKWVGGIVPAAVAGLLIFEIALPLYTAMGVQALPVVGVLLAALGTTLAPLVAEAPGVSVRRVSLTLAGATVILAVIAAVLPAYTAASPQRVTFEFVQNSDANRAEWLVATESGRLPLGLRFGHFSGRSREPFPWMRLPARAFVADAQPLNAPGPELRVLDERGVGGDLDVEAQLVSPRGAPVVALYFPPAVRVKSFTMQGERVPPLSPRAFRSTNGWQRFVCATTPAGGVVVSFVVEGGKTFDVVALDESYGLPAERGKLQQERPANAVQSQSGDVTAMTRTVTLGGAMAGKPR
jgi:hypothetical protein